MSGQEFFLTISTGGADLHKLVQKELRDQLQAKEVIRFGQARFFFRADALLISPERFASLCSPEKLYAVVLREATSEFAPSLTELEGSKAEDALAARIAACSGWSHALETWRRFVEYGSGDADFSMAPHTFRVTGKRAGKLLAHLGSTGISEAVGEALMQEHGWQVALRDFDVEVVVHVNDDMLIVALPLLERSSAQQATFALPGLVQPVAWAMAKSAEIAPGETVIDPMCGSGIILLEAAQCWSSGRFIGFDKDASQLSRSTANVQLLSARIRLRLGFVRADATRLPLPDACCDAVICDLPFGKQYGSEAENQTLYPEALTEFRRVLRPSGGRVVLLTNQANSQKLVDIFAARPEWEVTCRRRLTLGFMEGILFLARVRSGEFVSHPEGPAQVSLPPESMRLPWEDSRGRAKWSSFKAMGRPPLQPILNSKRAQDR